MAKIAFIFLTVFISIYCEILAGALGIILPVTVLSMFYISIAYGWNTGLAAGIIAGTVIDMLYGRSVIITPFFMMPAVAAAEFWLHRGDPVSVLPNLMPGALVAFLVSFPVLASNSYHTGVWLHNFYLLVFSVVSGALLLPLIIAFLDRLAEKLGLPLYRKAKALARHQRE